MTKDTPWPEEAEFVVATVRTLKGFGAFVLLDEYPGREGFIHITEIAPGWIKHIKDHIREGQKVVCKVLKVDEKKGHIDLSLKQVNEHQKRDKIMLWKANQKAEKLLELIAERLDWTVQKCHEEFADRLMMEFDSLYQAFEEVAINPDVLDELNMEGDWKEPFIQIALENIQPPYVEIKGVFVLRFHGPDGLGDLKTSLGSAASNEVPKGVKVSTAYLGAPKYLIKVTAPDYKVAEDVLSRSVETILDTAKSLKGEASFERVSRER